MAKAEPLEAGERKQGRANRAGLGLLEPRLDVAAQQRWPEVRPQAQGLGLAARRSGAEGRAMRQALDRVGEDRDVRDALVSVFADTIEGLPHGATFGAASLRRQAQALRLRPDLRPTLLRGNVETRLKKAEAGAVGATLLALAGLKRLGLSHRARAVLDLDRFLPAPGQGAIAITARSDDARALQALEPISDAATAAALAAERAFLAELEGSCRTPIAGLARLEAGRLQLRGEVLRADGSERFDIAAKSAPADAERLGREAGRDLAARLPVGVLVKGG